jgi:hypothetical protein
MLCRLGIEEEECDDLIFEEQDEAPKEGLKWMALAKFHTPNAFSPHAFEQNMKIAWSPAKEIVFNHLEGNLFTVQCFCLGDWLKVEKGGPWLFRQSVVSIEPYDGLALPETVDLNFFTTWVQIHKVPVGYRKESLIKNLTEKKLGKVVETQLDVKGAGIFFRVRVRMDVRKSLARFVSMSREGVREIYPIKFEKMPRFFGACGFIGHTHLECGTGEFEEDKLKWGDFLRADWDSWFGRGTGGGRGLGRYFGAGRGRMGGRARDEGTGGRGMGTPTSWRYNALAFVDGRALADNVLKNPGILNPANEKETDDTATSLEKKDMEVDRNKLLNTAAKRTLDMGQQESPEGIGEKVVVTNQALMMTVDGLIMEATGTEVDKDRAKRTKKDRANSSSLGSAGSLEDPVRSQ